MKEWINMDINAFIQIAFNQFKACKSMLIPLYLSCRVVSVSPHSHIQAAKCGQLTIGQFTALKKLSDAAGLGLQTVSYSGYIKAENHPSSL